MLLNQRSNSQFLVRLQVTAQFADSIGLNLNTFYHLTQSHILPLWVSQSAELLCVFPHLCTQSDALITLDGPPRIGHSPSVIGQLLSPPVLRTLLFHPHPLCLLHHHLTGTYPPLHPTRIRLGLLYRRTLIL